MGRLGIKSLVGANNQRGDVRNFAQALTKTDFTYDSDFALDNWKDWQPVVTLAGSAVTPFVRFFKYKLIGDCCFVTMRVDFTLTVAGGDLLITHPYPPKSLLTNGAQRIPVVAINNTVQELGVAIFVHEDSRVIFRRIPATNWSAAATNFVECNYFYLCTP